MPKSTSKPTDSAAEPSFITVLAKDTTPKPPGLIAVSVLEDTKPNPKTVKVTVRNVDADSHPNLHATLADLAPLAQTLNSESDDLNSTISALNRKIADLNLGIEAWCEARDGVEFGFARVNDEWQLAVREYGEEPNPDGRRMEDVTYHSSLLKRSRNERIDGLELVPEVLRGLKAEAERKVDAIRKAKRLAGIPLKLSL